MTETYPRLLSTFRFETADQEAFAALSGDYNPMHMDPVAARRTAAGAPVVHGIHMLIRCLDNLARTFPDLPCFSALKIRFDKLIYLGDAVQVILAQKTDQAARLDVVVDGVIVSRISLQFGTVGAAPAEFAVGADVYRPRPDLGPLDLTLDEMAGCSGRLQPAAPVSAIIERFPHASRVWGERRVSALASYTYLVGMICPGLHSIFGGLNLTGCEETGSGDGVAFRVTATDPRFRSVRMAVSGCGLAGTIESFARQPPAEQSSMAELAGLVAPDEFAAGTALIVGGSRGLGELSAKLLTTGGARVIVTYSTGESDARRLQQEIAAAGGQCDVMKYDVRASAEDQLAALPAVPSMMFYFATPSIFRRKSDLFVAGRFSEFLNFYVNGFYNLCAALSRRRPAGMSIFYPSSIAVENRPAEMTEYAMSKLAGEALCADMVNFQQPIAIRVSRLPRLPTDQTATLTAVETAEPRAVMLPIVRDVYAARLAAGGSKCDR